MTQIFVKMALLVLTIAIISGADGLAGVGKTSAEPPPIKVTLEPELPMIKGNLITLRLTYEIDSASSCSAAVVDTFSLIFINPRNYGDTLSRSDYQATHTKTLSRSAIIQTTLPDIDTCRVHLVISSGTCHMEFPYFFVTTGEDVELRQNFQMPMAAKYQALWTHEENRHSDPIRDTLTQEQLQTEYEIIIDLHDPAQFETARKIIGAIPDSCLYNKRHGLYKITTTLENLIKLGDENLEADFTTPPPWESKQ